MMTNQTIDMNSDTAKSAVQDVANSMAAEMLTLAEMLEKCGDCYGLLTTSLRWHAQRTVAGEFTDAYLNWMSSEIMKRRDNDQ